ncbi:hypothetical protein C0583_02550 [Candidatus Parcubacteria bacterium]|nr:MAG: hypothetical protein C0583_02550 [Candidatus Parcubacteria bacterium]
MTRNSKIPICGANKNKTSSFSDRSLEIIKANRERLHSILNKSIALLIVVFMVGYVVSINDLSIKGFILQDLKVTINELQIENERYELEAMALESYENINEKAKKIGMVKVDNIDYFTVVDGVVAKR